MELASGDPVAKQQGKGAITASESSGRSPDAAFTYRFLDRRLPWLRIMSFDIPQAKGFDATGVGRATDRTDTAGVMELLPELAYTDMHKQDAFILQTDNLLQVVRMQQMMLQFMVHERVQLQAQLLRGEEKEALVDECIRTMATVTLEPLPALMATTTASFARLQALDLNMIFAPAPARVPLSGEVKSAGTA